MNKLTTANRVRVIAALVEGCSIRSTARMIFHFAFCISSVRSLVKQGQLVAIIGLGMLRTVA